MLKHDINFIPSQESPTILKNTYNNGISEYFHKQYESSAEKYFEKLFFFFINKKVKVGFIQIYLTRNFILHLDDYHNNSLGFTNLIHYLI